MLEADLKDYLIELSEIINEIVPLECVILFGSRQEVIIWKIVTLI